MNAYTLPNPAAFERKLQKRLSGASRLLAAWDEFADGEMRVRVSSVGRRAAVIGWSAPPADDAVLTAMLCDALRRNGAKDVPLILPYYAYARQDRVDAPGQGVGASCMAAMFAAAGATRILTVDLHRKGFASPIPVESVSVLPEMASRLRRRAGGGLTVVAPDAGARERAALFHGTFGGPEPVWIEKRRSVSGLPKALKLHGRFRGGDAVIVDDLVDEGRTVEQAARLLRAKGAERLWLCAAHPVLSDDSIERLTGLGLEGALFSDTLDLPDDAGRLPGLEIVSAIPSLAAAALLQDLD